MSLDAFIAKWKDTAAAERANKDSFLNELCDELGVARPDPTTGDPLRDRYVFEFPVTTMHAGGKHSVRKVDLYRESRFLLEAKQGGGDGQKKGFAKRNTPAWNVEMDKARGQALGYVRSLDDPPPFLVVADIGFCFDLYADFDGSRTYRPFPNAQQSRLYFADLAKHTETLRAVWNDPNSLDPSRKAARVTREVAAHLADLAKALEGSGHAPELVARFLMRCIFTMFAEDVGLLPKDLFRDAIKDHWLKAPETFVPGVEELWRKMNTGGHFGAASKLLRFNGGLFREAHVLPLTRRQLEVMLTAAKCDWHEVEPAIFGTLLERALDPRERHRLGAHYTPRAYVERLVRPTIEEPLRAEWDAVRAEVQRLVGAGGEGASADDDPVPAVKGKGNGKAPKALKAAPSTQTQVQRVKRAAAAVRAFRARLCNVRVLDPACGSGNFLYVSMEVLKRIESEVIATLATLTPAGEALFIEGATVTPRQFLGVEKKPWAKEIAELVLWIGFLQWHARTRRNADGRVAWIEPVLQDLHNIECRDAVLEWDAEEPVLDGKGKPITRWDGVTTKKHPVTGEEVPDDSARVPVTTLTNPRRAVWPKADFIVGNPPFLGNKRLRIALGDAYVEALRSAWDGVPETADLVMYWWNAAGELLRSGDIRQFGFITTNSATQTYARKVIERHLEGEGGASIIFAIPDHPWVDASDGAAVRIAMSVVRSGRSDGTIQMVVAEAEDGQGEVSVSLSGRSGLINSDFTIGCDASAARPLQANRSLAFRGITLVGDGFLLSRESPLASGGAVRPIVGARSLLSAQEPRRVIDFFGVTEEEARTSHPAQYQHLYDTVRPLRLQQKRRTYAEQWWLFAEPRAGFRAGAAALRRYVATVETSRHRWFTFVPADRLPEQTLIAICLDDAFALGVLSSRAHVAWSRKAGGRLGVGNDLRYTIARCFDPFPFPEASVAQRTQISTAAERLDAHRKLRQATHPSLSITSMYNVLDRLRADESLTEKEKTTHDQGIVSVLRQLHDELDAAVFDAYGWPATLTDEEILERVVALNAERTAEEKRGVIRWLRPDFQDPKAADQQLATAVDEPDGEGATPAADTGEPWPAKLAEQFSAVGARLVSLGGAATSAELAASFKGAGEATIRDVLEALESVGRAVVFDDGGVRRWKSVAATA